MGNYYKMPWCIEPNGGPETSGVSEILSGGLQGQTVFAILTKYLPFSL